MRPINVVNVIRWIAGTVLICAAMVLPLRQCVAQGSVTITVLAGGNVPFVFNSIEKYKNGITYLNYTRFGIDIEDLAGPINYYWRLTAQAATPTILGSGVNFLPLTTLELTASDPTGVLTGKFAEFFGPIPLSVAPGVLVCRGVAPCFIVPSPVLVIGEEPNYSTTLDEVQITYECGTTTSLLGAISDYYVVDINFDVEACFDPGPCGF